MTDLDHLCSELASGDDERAEAAAARLPDLGLPALQAVRDLLRAGEADTRWWAIRALAGFEDVSPALDNLRSALQDKSAEIRQAAALALWHHPDQSALPALIHALGDSDPLTGRLASNAIIMLGTQAAPSLLEVLKNGKQNAKLEAARALSEIKDPGSIPGLMQAMENGSAMTQYWASLGLEKMGVGMLYLKPE